MSRCHGAVDAIVGPHAAVVGLAGGGRQGSRVFCARWAMRVAVGVVVSLEDGGRPASSRHVRFVTTDAPANGRAAHRGKASAQWELGRARTYKILLLISGRGRIEDCAGGSGRDDTHSETQPTGHFRIGQPASPT